MMQDQRFCVIARLKSGYFQILATAGHVCCESLLHQLDHCKLLLQIFSSQTNRQALSQELTLASRFYEDSKVLLKWPG